MELSGTTNSRRADEHWVKNWEQDPEKILSEQYHSPLWKFSRIQVWPLTSKSAFVGKSPNFVPFLLISEEGLDTLTSLGPGLHIGTLVPLHSNCHINIFQRCCIPTVQKQRLLQLQALSHLAQDPSDGPSVRSVRSIARIQMLSHFSQEASATEWQGDLLSFSRKRKKISKKRLSWVDDRGACYSIYCAIYENKAVKSYFMDVSQANFYAKLCMKLGAYEKKNVKLFRNNVYEIP